jgi:hypothetical protein
LFSTPQNFWRSLINAEQSMHAHTFSGLMIKME